MRHRADRVLDGMTVLELGSFITAPYAGLLLADLGADVIKVEPPGGDPFRSFAGGKYSPNFVAYNRNKRSVVLDVKTAADRKTLLAMIDEADVLIENFRPGVMERNRLGYASLKRRNPGLIYCAISGFNPTGPNRDRPAFDMIGQCISGLLGLLLDPERPMVRGPTVSDQLAGLYACYGILGALIARQASGKGRRVDVNMIEATMSFMPDIFASYTRENVVMNSRTRAGYSQAYVLVCADGKMVGIQLSSLDKFWVNLTDAIGRPDLQADPRFSSRMQRIKHTEVLNALLTDVFRERSRSEWLRRLERADVPHAPVHGVDDVLEDPEIKACDTFYSVTHPQMGEVRCIHRPVLYDGRRTAGSSPPVLGEHSEEVIAALRSAPPRRPAAKPPKAAKAVKRRATSNRAKSSGSGRAKSGKTKSGKTKSGKTKSSTAKSGRAS